MARANAETATVATLVLASALAACSTDLSGLAEGRVPNEAGTGPEGARNGAPTGDANRGQVRVLRVGPRLAGRCVLLSSIRRAAAP